MNNPWVTLPQTEPFVLEKDRQGILDFNSKAKPEHRIHLELLPEPYLGNPTAKVILLNLNPGYSEGDIIFHRDNEFFIKTCRENLLHNEQEYPFYLLNPYNYQSPGFKWWHKRLKPLIELYGLKKVANSICCIEFFPYHSENYRQMRSPLPSQSYSFHLVREAIKRSAMIVVMRSQKNWLEQVPELRNHNFYTLSSVQNVTVSQSNLRSGFSELVRLLD
jgi:hypothetical protein